MAAITVVLFNSVHILDYIPCCDCFWCGFFILVHFAPCVTVFSYIIFNSVNIPYLLGTAAFLMGSVHMPYLILTVPVMVWVVITFLPSRVGICTDVVSILILYLVCDCFCSGRFSNIISLFKGTVARDFRPLVFFMNGPNKDP